MEYEIVNLEEKKLVGIHAKTGNSALDSKEVIQNLWGKFFIDNLFDKINNKSSQCPICLYSDYDNTNISGGDLQYELTIGYNVSEGTYPEYTSKTIPKCKYAKFLVEGNSAIIVRETWEKIWKMPLDRSFTGDFEEYLDISSDNVKLAIYIALK